MSKLKPYPEYKDSGIEWVGMIPEDWKRVKLKYLCNEIAVYGLNESSESYSDTGTRLLRTTDIDDKGNLKKDNAVYIDMSHVDYAKAQLLEKNDLLFSRSGTVGRTYIHTKEEPMTFASYLVKFKVRSNYSPKFIYYFTKGHHFIGWINSILITSTISNVNGTRYANMPLAIPNLKGQNLISSFLDRKTGDIDYLIKDKERLIELLEEKRQAIITETVTKGLDPNVKMKDSRIEWIGEIPEHWEVVKIKYLSNESLVYGANESALDNEKGEWRYIRITDIDEEGNLRKDTRKTLPINIAEKYPVTYGDVLFARSGATVGKTYIHESEEKACYAGYLIKYRANPEQLLSKLFYYFTQSKAYKSWVREQLIQATIENISAEKYANLFIPLPNLHEQKRIIEFLDNYHKQHNEVKEEMLRQISKLKEYRESLIYEAVTGKIDLRNYELETINQ